MTEYWVTLIGVCLMGSLVQLLAPEGDVRRYVRLAASFCLLLSISSPLIECLGEVRGMEVSEWLGALGTEESVDYDEIYKQSLMDGGAAYAEEQMTARILREFSLEEGDLTVKGTFETKNGTREIKEAVLILQRTTVSVDPRALSDFVKGLWSCDCRILYGNGDEK